ncbi:MAG: cyclic nucleotide-binding/CBS domain-containing protein [Alphaproteobacteria bacterium]
MTIRRVTEMVRDQRPLKLPHHATVCEACRHMHARRVGAVLVTDENGRLAGILTGRDVVGRVVAEGRDPAATTLAMVMTPAPTTMRPRHTAVDALRVMQDGGFRHVPIVEEGRIVGIVSRGDFLAPELARLDEETGLWERL